MMRLARQSGILLVATFLLTGSSQAKVIGRVLNLITHEPIPNAEVTLACLEVVYRNAPCQTSSTTTSQDGAFSFNAPGDVKYLLSATAIGMAQTRDSSTELVISFRKRVFTFSGDLQLAPESTMSGKVVDVEKHPHPGIEVIAWRQYTTGPFTRLRAVAKSN